MTQEQAKILIDLIEKAEIGECFIKIQDFKIEDSILNKLKNDYAVLGVSDGDFYNRLKIRIKNLEVNPKKNKENKILIKKNIKTIIQLSIFIPIIATLAFPIIYFISQIKITDTQKKNTTKLRPPQFTDSLSNNIIEIIDTLVDDKGKEIETMTLLVRGFHWSEVLPHQYAYYNTEQWYNTISNTTYMGKTESISSRIDGSAIKKRIKEKKLKAIICFGTQSLDEVPHCQFDYLYHWNPQTSTPNTASICQQFSEFLNDNDIKKSDLAKYSKKNYDVLYYNTKQFFISTSSKI